MVLGGFFMQKAIICGVYQFLGFQLCSYLLESGVEIVGFTPPAISIDHLEEKKMEIGRNANFNERKWNDFHQVVQLNDSHLFIDLYSLNSERIIYSTVKKLLEEKAVQSALENVSVTILANITSLTSKEPAFWEQENFKDLNLKVIYLPTLYGPWQPHEFSFQQLLSNKEKEIQVNDAEYILDAIYIEDAVMEIIRQSKKIESASLVFRSNVSNHWKACTELLEWNVQLPRNHARIISFEEMMEVIVTNKHSLRDNLDKQKKHYELFRI